MSEGLFRKKSLERISSPEKLNDYLHVTNPGVWIAMITVVFFLIAIFVWSIFASIESYAFGTAMCEDGVITVYFDDQVIAEKIEQGMEVNIGELTVPINFVGNDDEGNRIAVAYGNIPDGKYSSKVGYKHTQIFRMLFN